MKAKDLIKILEQCPDREVVLQKDAEGNGYSTLRGAWKGKYDPRYFEVGLEELTEEDIKEGYGEEDLMKDGVKAIILYP